MSTATAQQIAITITPQTIITAAAFIAAVIALFRYLFKSRDWVVRQDKQDAENKSEVEKLKKHHDDDITEIKEELQLLTHGVLACLKGLNEKGCNGPVTETITMLEEHLNKKAHR